MTFVSLAFVLGMLAAGFGITFGDEDRLLTSHAPENVQETTCEKMSPSCVELIRTTISYLDDIDRQINQAKNRILALAIPNRRCIKGFKLSARAKSCYRVLDQDDYKLNWRKARRFCQSLSSKHTIDLITIKTKEDLVDVWVQTQTFGKGLYYFTSGVHMGAAGIVLSALDASPYNSSVFFPTPTVLPAHNAFPPTTAEIPVHNADSCTVVALYTAALLRNKCFEDNSFICEQLN
ncbi:hypothetical protein CAPTEDRAFT_186997 [Capitella teleta]|uniref:C-type lectin domain-containing protein n=1 Tax=Capitella teleta TaxID=283909 RepID=R7V339_CAPTE|nr:hypothetical protein CAPTEDRAFT_186997 [Capitella teleta]|eukprot:ELU10736.1 hypothetical protein CAPTEDRAFT_186997 [Capitella teleta]